MDNYIFKLRFKSAVRFGIDKASGGLASSNYTCHADTLFSALCSECLRVFGEEEMSQLVEEAKQGRLLISDMMPWIGQEFYLPKPVIYVEKENPSREEPELSTDRKKLKNILYIPASRFKDYMSYLGKGGPLPFQHEEPAVEALYPKASIAREDMTMPYLVSAYLFKEESGLYFILRSENAERVEQLETLVENLGCTGIGGKKTTGFGKFEFAEDPIEFGMGFGLYDSDIEIGKMLGSKGSLYMALSVVSPSKQDLGSFSREKSFYTIIQRTGFIDSATYYGRPLKRKQVAMFGPGSCFNAPLEGCVLDLSSQGAHPIYRYGKGMYLGVTL